MRMAFGRTLAHIPAGPVDTQSQIDFFGHRELRWCCKADNVTKDILTILQDDITDGLVRGTTIKARQTKVEFRVAGHNILDAVVGSGSHRVKRLRRLPKTKSDLLGCTIVT